MKRNAISLEDRTQALADAADAWLGDSVPVGEDRAPAVAGMLACLLSAVLVFVLSVPVLAIAFPFAHSVAAALSLAALPLAVAGVLSATGSVMVAGHAALAFAAAALAALALMAGGAQSAFLVLLALIPLEAALAARSRTGFIAGCGAAATAYVTVWLATRAGLAAPVPAGVEGAALAALVVHAATRGFLHVAISPARSKALLPDAKAHEPVFERIALPDMLDRLPGLVTLHGPRGEVSRVTGAAQNAFAAWMGDATGHGFVTRIHVSDRIAFLEAFDAMRLGAPSAHVEVRMEHAAPSLERQFAHVAIDLIAEHDGHGCFIGAIAQTRDISEQVAVRARESEIAAQAESANAAKTRFLAAVSHELRTPLNAIIGFSDILAREYFGTFSDERQREYVGLIHQSGEHLLSLVNTMLDMSKIESGRYELFAEAFRIAEVVECCDAMLALQASRKGVTLTRRVARGLEEVVADRRAVQQILINLLGNAIKFTEAGGVITLDADRVDTVLRLAVSDTGVGIPSDKLARIGEPFMQVQNSLARNYEGTGLGLSLVKGLVDLHGGSFRIESREGEGTTVTIELPIDGSGVREPETEGLGGPVAFPPRLPVAPLKQPQSRNKAHDATARTA